MICFQFFNFLFLPSLAVCFSLLPFNNRNLIPTNVHTCYHRRSLFSSSCLLAPILYTCCIFNASFSLSLSLSPWFDFHVLVLVVVDICVLFQVTTWTPLSSFFSPHLSPPDYLPLFIFLLVLDASFLSISYISGFHFLHGSIDLNLAPLPTVPCIIPCSPVQFSHLSSS